MLDGSNCAEDESTKSEEGKNNQVLGDGYKMDCW